MFGRNYTLGTRNINLEAIERIEAFDKYSDNPLLKEIEDSEKTALNLKLKENAIDFSGSIEGGIGLNYNNEIVGKFDGNLLAISKRYKSFATTAYNNLGINRTPFNYFSNHASVERVQNQTDEVKGLIDDVVTGISLDETRANVNNQMFTNYNGSIKVGKHSSIRANLYSLNDKLLFLQKLSSLNVFNDDTITFVNATNITKRPRLHRADMNVKYTEGKLQVEYDFKVSYEKVNTNGFATANEATALETRLHSTIISVNQHLVYTQKLSRLRAMQLSVSRSQSSLKQEYALAPSAFSQSLYNEDLQNVNLTRGILDANFMLLGSPGKSKYSLSLGMVMEDQPLRTDLSHSQQGVGVTTTSQNDVKYGRIGIHNSGTYVMTLNKIKLTGSYFLRHLRQNINDVIGAKTFSKDNFIFEPHFSIRYLINDYSFLLWSFTKKQTPQVNAFAFNNDVLINNRSLTSNRLTLDLRDVSSHTLMYYINDLYTQFNLNLGLTYQRSNGNYVSDISINDNFTYTRYFFARTNFDNLSFHLNSGKYISLIQSTINLTSAATISNYSNSVNSSELRSNKNAQYSFKLSLRTSFELPFNLQANIESINLRSLSVGNQSFSNTAVNLSSQLTVTPIKSLTFYFNADHFTPDYNRTTNYTFLDFILAFTPSQRPYEISLAGKNLLNNNEFLQVETSDYSINTLTTNLIGKYFLLNISCRL